jgi:hypothetical protein
MVVNYMLMQVQNALKGNHFRFIGFTTSNGQPIVYAIIIAASKLKVTGVTGFNLLSEYTKDVSGEEIKVLQEEIDAMKDDHSYGADCILPFRPTGTFNGVEVTTYVTCSKSGSITSQLLTNMLSRIDDHISRFEEPFIEYTLDSNHPWTCFIACHMGCMCASSETVQSRIGCSRLR